MLELLLIFQQLIASGTHIVAKGLTEDVQPATALFLRALTASTMFALWIFWKRKHIKKLEKKDFWLLILLGTLNIPSNQYLFLLSIELTSPPNIALAYALTPAFVLIIAMMFLGEKATPLKISGIAVAIFGTILVLFEKGINFRSEGFIGDLLGLLASFSWALYTVIGKSFTKKYGAAYSTGLSMISGFLLYLPIYFFLPGKTTIPSLTAINWLQVLYLGTLTSGLGYAIWYYALKKIEASKLSVFNNLQPIFTTILAIIIFGYAITPLFVIGGILIILGVVLTQRG